VLLGGTSQNDAGLYGSRVLASQPITFRAPFTAPAQITATPTTGVHGGTPGTLSLKPGSLVPDGYDSFTLLECNAAMYDQLKNKDWQYGACGGHYDVKVSNNTFAPTQFSYFEKNYRPGAVCDPSDKCFLVLIGQKDDDPRDKVAVVSNTIAFSFRPQNFGTPTLTLSKRKGLSKGDTVSIKATDVPDMISAIDVYECNVKGGYDSERCVPLHVSGDHVDFGAAIVRDNAAAGTVKIKAGKVGSTDSGKTTYCTAKTNGQCALVAVTYPSNKYHFQSSTIKFG
jgi:hypothetical protein